ncbi:hypothetical protein QBC37DRAFT_37553 [Rhypophila decipiens]|uniref:Peptidase C14 caspase domain-containing protein n=1 Tax=Rhypophila decipiens TaxID=261697 RepID=A0AAN7B4Z4_9PEZI|nr:hypothetical protein QBC37DRAFT_37553 [Rhypophila decipiens]
MNDDDDITSLWQRHLLAAVRDNLSAASVQAIPSVPRSLDGDELMTNEKKKEPVQVGADWDEQMDSVVGALHELTVQSPTTINTADAYSPETPWFPDREGYTETALSSPQNSSWSRTIKTAMQAKRLSAPDEFIDLASESSRQSPRGKGKGLDLRHQQVPSPTLPARRQPALPSWYTERNIPTYNTKAEPESISYEDYYRQYNPNSERNMPPDPPTVTVRYAPSRVSRMMETPPQEVHVLILTWAKRDDNNGRRTVDEAPLLSPTLDMETEAVRSSFKRRGYRVQCRRIPEDYPTAAVETILDKFLDKSVEGKSLLVVYYHGYGNTDQSGRMVFSSDQHATSSFFWDDVRDPIMQSPGDVLLIFDCCPLPSNQSQYGQKHNPMRPADDGTLLIEAGMISSPSTKQLLGVCASPPRGFGQQQQIDAKTPIDAICPQGMMTTALCRILDNTFADRQVSVQNLCSSIKEDLRLGGTEDKMSLAFKVFVTQLGGGQLGDICLPRFRD